jgi:beta-lactamase superfamily II metal-dependent hydrolase
MDLGNQFEIDFLPVGEGEKSGDAIAMRFGDFSENGTQFVVVIDGGDRDTGNRLVQHIRNHYRSETVDLIISTHPDSDHTSGLRIVMEELNVKGLWMHLPWEHSDRICNLFTDGRITDESMRKRLRKAYRYAYELEKLAIKKNVPITEPFAGLESNWGILKILGPEENYYRELLTDSAKTPEKKEGLAGSVSIFERAKTFAKSVVNWVTETLEYGLLDDTGETSAENNSSVVTLFEFDGKKILFTGDTGMPALNRVIEYCKLNGITLSDLSLVQIPHHGAKRNISPDIIKSICAPIAIVSSSKNAPKHPSYQVTNEFHRNGSQVATTEDGIFCFCNNVAARPGYNSFTPIGFKSHVQE